MSQNTASSLQGDRKTACTEKAQAAGAPPSAFREGPRNGSLGARAAAEERPAELCCPLLDGTRSPRQPVWSQRASSRGTRVLIQQLTQQPAAARARRRKGHH